MMFTTVQVSVLERMDEGLKVLECLLPAYFRVDLVTIIIVIIISIVIIVVIVIIIVIIIIVIVFRLPTSRW